MNQPPTTLNPDEAPLFDAPIPANLPQRKMDIKLLEGIDEDRRRSREHSNRLTRLESKFEQIDRNIQKLEEGQRDEAGWHEQTATAIAAFGNKFAIHADREEYQWQVVNDTHKRLEEMSAALNAHLESSGAINARLDWIQLSVFSLYGAIGSLMLLFGGWLLSKI